MKNNVQEIIRVENLYRSYKNSVTGKEEKVLKGLNFRINKGDFVGIMGKSGCGKTTLLKVMGLMDKPTSGNVYFENLNTEDLWDDELADIRRRKIGFIFQDYCLMDSLSVRENIMLPMILDKIEDRECINKAEQFARDFGLSNLLDKNPYELSGGEKQRVAIARALVNNPEVILADEPTGNLDSNAAENVIFTLKKINQAMGKTIVIVTHDSTIAYYCKKIFFIKDGVISEKKPGKYF